jgi:hypothetical protein
MSNNRNAGALLRRAVRPAGPIAAAVAAITLAGCTAAAPPAASRNPYVPPGWTYWNGGYYAPPPAPAPQLPASRYPEPTSVNIPASVPPSIRDPPPLRAVDPDPPVFRSPPPIPLLSPPADATDCTGWWRTCHLY